MSVQSNRKPDNGENRMNFIPPSYMYLWWVSRGKTIWRPWFSYHTLKGCWERVRGWGISRGNLAETRRGGGVGPSAGHDKEWWWWITELLVKIWISIASHLCFALLSKVQNISPRKWFTLIRFAHELLKFPEGLSVCHRRKRGYWKFKNWSIRINVRMIQTVMNFF